MKNQKEVLKSKIIEKVQNTFLDIVKKGFNETKSIEKLNSLKKQYIGLPNDALAEILIKRAVRKTTIEGAANGGGISACELSIVATKGAAAPAAVPGIIALIGADVTYTTSIQMQLIMDISQLYECPFNKENEEDVWQIFKAALGIKGIEKIGGYVRFIFYEAAKKQFRRLLRTGIRRAVQNMVVKIAGKQIGRYLGEKYVMRIIPGLNVILGGYFNNRITKAIGKWSKIKVKIRTSTFKQIDQINKFNSEYKVLVLPLLFIIGTLEDKITDNFLTLYIQTQNRLGLDEKQIKFIEKMINEESLENKLKDSYRQIKEPLVKSSLLDIAITTAAVNINTSKLHEEYLNNVANWLKLKFNKKDLKDKVNYLKR